VVQEAAEKKHVDNGPDDHDGEETRSPSHGASGRRPVRRGRARRLISRRVFVPVALPGRSRHEDDRRPDRETRSGNEG
jgi:hypothetical protein